MVYCELDLFTDSLVRLQLALPMDSRAQSPGVNRKSLFRHCNLCVDLFDSHGREKRLFAVRVVP